jgi:wyosine [tRNA(Phe)-imidazoG37] synthetase (radical SAM superfamily)
MPAMSIIYGPVPSWRLGRSLGIDLLNTRRKICSFNCVYCQLGKTGQFIVEPREFISLQQLASEIKLLSPVKADYATFSGMGEPTLASNLGEAIELVRSISDLPVAVLTNSSLMFRQDVRQQLAHADTVVAKLDVPNEELFAMVNRPAPGLHFDQIKDGIRLFRDKYRGKLALQVMFIEANKDYGSEIAALARQISPDEVQINTPLRPCAVRPLPAEGIAEIQREFADFKSVVSVYKAPKRKVMPLDLAETLRRRPKF